MSEGCFDSIGSAVLESNLVRMLRVMATCSPFSHPPLLGNLHVSMAKKNARFVQSMYSSSVFMHTSGYMRLLVLQTLWMKQCSRATRKL